jgi:xylan 1,4-beta-xylosidase
MKTVIIISLLINLCFIANSQYQTKNINSTVDMYYSTDGVHWEKIENSVEVSALHHNVLGGFLSLRLGLCSMGKGLVRFKNFSYTPIK